MSTKFREKSLFDSNSALFTYTGFNKTSDIDVEKVLEKIVLKTYMDQPIYVSPSLDVRIKRKPRNIQSVFYVINVFRTSESVDHPLMNLVEKSFLEVTGEKPDRVEKFKIIYEVYRGDMRQLIGKAEAYVIEAYSRLTPFSKEKQKRKKAWAYGFGWKKRIVNKYPELANYIYVIGRNKMGNRAEVQLLVKLPVVTNSLREVFKQVFENRS